MNLNGTKDGITIMPLKGTMPSKISGSVIT